MTDEMFTTIVTSAAARSAACATAGGKQILRSGMFDADSTRQYVKYLQAVKQEINKALSEKIEYFESTV